MKNTPLASLPKGTKAVVRKLNLAKPIVAKFIGLGFIPNTPIKVLHKNYSKIVVKLDNLMLALDKEIAKQVLVSVAGAVEAKT